MANFLAGSRLTGEGARASAEFREELYSFWSGLGLQHGLAATGVAMTPLALLAGAY